MDTHNQNYASDPRPIANLTEVDPAYFADNPRQLAQIKLGDQDGHLSVEPPPPDIDNRVRLFKGVDEFGNFWSGRGELNAPMHLPTERFPVSNFMLTPLVLRMVAFCQDNERNARIHGTRFDHDITDGLPKANSFLGAERVDSINHRIPACDAEFAQWQSLWKEAKLASHTVVDAPTANNIRRSVLAYISHVGALDALPGRVVKLSRMLFPVAHCRPVLMVGGADELPALQHARDLYLKSRRGLC